MAEGLPPGRPMPVTKPLTDLMRDPNHAREPSAPFETDRSTPTGMALAEVAVNPQHARTGTRLPRDVSRWGEYVVVVQEALRDRVRAPLGGVSGDEREAVQRELRQANYAVDDELWRIVNGRLIEPRWRMAVVFDNLVVCAAALMVERRTRRDKAPRRVFHLDAIMHLVNQLRQVAGDQPYGERLRETLEASAAMLQREILGWAPRFFQTPPRDAKRLLELRIDILLWTIQALRGAVLKEARVWTHDPARYHAGWTAPFRQLADAADDAASHTSVPTELAAGLRELGQGHNLRARADRLTTRMRNGTQHHLIGYVLQDVLTYGAFLPNGSPRR